MFKSKITKVLSIIMVLSIILTACSGNTAQPPAGAQPAAENKEEAQLDRSKHFITVATGPTSGLYYPIGGAFSSVFGTLGYKSSAQSTGASVENINLIINGDAEMAITMSDSVAQAYDAFGAYEGKTPAKDLMAITGLYPNYVQLITTKKTGITKFEDLKGKRVGVGAPNSGVELNARMMYEAHDMTYEDSKVDYLNYGEAIEQMQNGQVDAVFVTSGIPNATIMELGVSEEIVIVPIEGEGLKNLTEKYPFFVPEIIPKDAYSTETDVNTVTVRNIMLVRKDLPEDVVYDLTKGIFENIDTIQASHATAAKHISLENSHIGVDIPFHPGAVKYYQEKGIE
ncbi:MAG: TAXI family TRAP transporter solute-binding subunit [Sedimentibacter sp.]